MTRIPDLPRVLHWAIVRHYLALRMQEDSDEHTGRRGIAAGIFAAWLAAFGFLFYGLAGPLFAANGPGAAVWKAIFSVAGLFYAAWLISVFVGLARTASRLREGSHLNQIVPAADLIEYWKAQCGLIRHVPRLLDAQWTWSSVPAGSYLIRYGNTDRTFFWLAEGRTRVIAHPPGSEPMHVATLGAGTGVGEISLLDNEPRTADVIVEEAAIVATLSRDALDAVADEATYDRFRDVVLAGQALSRSTVFHGLPDADRERWIAYGTPRRYDTGEPVILQGAVESWVGLVVSGTVVVERGEQTIAVLGHDEVFGEIAYLTDAPRNASIRATDSLLVWRWDKNWLDAELMRGGVGDALLKLAVERQNIQ